MDGVLLAGGVDAPPLPRAPVDLDAPAFHLDDAQPIRGVHDDEVCLPVTQVTRLVAAQPGDAVEHAPARRRLGEGVEDAHLGTSRAVVAQAGREPLGEHLAHGGLPIVAGGEEHGAGSERW